MNTAHATWVRRIIYDKTNTVDTEEGSEIVSLPEKLPPGPARVEGWKSEKIPGPKGSFCSVEIGVSVKLAVRQTKPDISMGAKQCIDIAGQVIDELYEEAHDTLISHMEKLDQ